MDLFDFLPRKNKGDKKDGKKKDETLLEKIRVTLNLSIPKAFAQHWPEIEKTKLTYVSITATPKNDLTLTQSKLGHYPCMPLDFDYPTDSEGEFMFPLAQINCNEMPVLEGYPGSGYLQFYISAYDDVYGLDPDDPQSQENFRVLYFEEHEVEKHKTDFSFLNEIMKENESPVPKPYTLSFSLKEEYIGINDVRGIDNEEFSIMDIAEKYPAIEDELQEAAYDVFQGNGHKIGGYAFFTQEDPRTIGGDCRDYILLFQLDSDNDIMWGDAGVGNFFIDKNDLAKKDFSKVMYNWDCS